MTEAVAPGDRVAPASQTTGLPKLLSGVHRTYSGFICALVPPATVTITTMLLLVQKMTSESGVCSRLPCRSR